MAVLVLVSGLILEQINTNRRLMAKNLHQQEVLSVATMAVQTKQDQLTLNGITVTVIRQQENQDWLLFVQQMEAELEGCQLVKVEGNKLYVKQDNQDLAFGISNASDFRKTNADGRGYQPMLFGLKSSTISQKNQIVTIEVILKNGLQRSFVYAFEKTS